MPIINRNDIKFYVFRKKYYCQSCGPMRELDIDTKSIVTSKGYINFPNGTLVYCDDCKELIDEIEHEQIDVADEDLPF